MADEPENETTETPEPAGGAEQAAETQAPKAAEAPQADAPEAPAAEADAPAEAAAEPEPETPAPAVAAPTPEPEPVDERTPKQRRRDTRSAHTGETRASRTPEERHAERVAMRKTKAVRRRARRLQERAKAAERRAAAPAPEPLAPVHAPVEGRRRMRQGIVTSDKASKTITVRIDFARRHRRYEKIVRSSTTLHAHDENNDAREGDVVRVIESRPLSRSKRWALVDVLERAR
jgi:small subunit ribosomal protein S17